MANRMKGTCPCCFGEFDVEAGSGRIGRHGWKEIGDRRVGMYGRAMHTGSCFGVSYPAFEISSEGTEAYLAKVLIPTIEAVNKELERLANRPSLTVAYDFYASGGFRNAEKRSYVLKDGDEGVSVDCEPERNGYARKKHFSYDYYLGVAIRKAERDLKLFESDRDRLEAAVASWKPGELKAKKAKGPTVHLEVVRRGNSYAACGSKSHFVKLDADESAVTCSRCKRSIEDAKKERATKAAVEADNKALVAFLTKEGRPLPAKVIKAALGWDAKRFNKAKDFNYEVSTAYASRGPNRYEVKA